MIHYCRANSNIIASMRLSVKLLILQYYFHFYDSFSSYSSLHQQFSIQILRTKLEWEQHVYDDLNVAQNCIYSINK